MFQLKPVSLLLNVLHNSKLRHQSIPERSNSSLQTARGVLQSAHRVHGLKLPWSQKQCFSVLVTSHLYVSFRPTVENSCVVGILTGILHFVVSWKTIKNVDDSSCALIFHFNTFFIFWHWCVKTRTPSEQRSVSQPHRFLNKNTMSLLFDWFRWSWIIFNGESISWCPATALLPLWTGAVLVAIVTTNCC